MWEEASMKTHVLAAWIVAGAAGCGVHIGGDPSDPSARPDANTGNDTAPLNCGDATFNLNETQEVFVVPDNVTFLHIKAWGAGGNGESLAGTGVCAYDDGGVGGYSEGIFPVTAGAPLIIIVGKRGRAGMTNEDRRRFGFGEWGGGGLSGVFRGSELITQADFNRALIIAGGGGSASAYSCDPGGTGNHPTESGGMPDMQGGTGNVPSHDNPVNGGAGGFRGGLGGAYEASSAGGTGHIDPSAIDQLILWSQRGIGSPPKTDDVDYADNAGKTESSGRVVMHFRCEPGQIL